MCFSSEIKSNTFCSSEFSFKDMIFSVFSVVPDVTDVTEWRHNGIIFVTMLFCFPIVSIGLPMLASLKLPYPVSLWCVAPPSSTVAMLVPCCLHFVLLENFKISMLSSNVSFMSLVFSLLSSVWQWLCNMSQYWCNSNVDATHLWKLTLRLLQDIFTTM